MTYMFLETVVCLLDPEEGSSDNEDGVARPFLIQVDALIVFPCNGKIIVNFIQYNT